MCEGGGGGTHSFLSGFVWSSNIVVKFRSALGYKVYQDIKKDPLSVLCVM